MENGGSVWKAWLSRIISVTLVDDSFRGSNRLHVLSCYAPTFSATRQEKDSFYSTLQLALDAIPLREGFLFLGDFNARIGSRSRFEEDEWWNVRGPHGLGIMNEAGREFLSFLAMNQATVCNTWFEKKSIYKSTWQHPKSKQWHCIDYGILKQKDRRRCLDVSVMRGADFNTDHHLLRMKL